VSRPFPVQRLPFTLFLLLACSSGEKAKPVNWSQVPVSIELRLARGAPGSGFTPAAMYGRPGTIYLSPQVQLSNADIARVEATVARVGQGLILDVWLSRAGARRMADLTRRHMGDSLAVVINSAVVAVPVIQQALDIGAGQPASIGVPLRPEEAHRLAQAVAKTWPSAPQKAAK
jgi:preprotein translocase subunit SecD